MTDSGLTAFALRRDRLSSEAALSQYMPRMPWDTFNQRLFHPQPGEHIGIIGPTGKGKTLLQNHILPRFMFVAVFATKPQDATMEQLVRDGGYVRLQHWRSLNPIDFPRRVIWPDASSINSVANQRRVFADAFDKIFREGGRPAESPIGWALAVDELWYVINRLGLDDQVKQFLMQGRSLGHSIILATQRPSSVPLEVYDQSTHLFLFRDNDKRNVDRLSEVGSVDSGLVRYALPRLEKFQVLYINNVTGQMARTRIWKG